MTTTGGPSEGGVVGILAEGTEAWAGGVEDRRWVGGVVWTWSCIMRLECLSNFAAFPVCELGSNSGALMGTSTW